jgi:hypothetical protein
MLRDVAMKRMVLPLTVGFLLGFGATALAETDAMTSKGNGPAAGADSVESESKTGETAECPIKKTLGAKTYCFQNDPALTKPQGGR